MFGWFSAASSFASRSNRATLSLSSKKSSGRTLSATARSRRASFARYTSPIPPRRGARGSRTGRAACRKQGSSAGTGRDVHGLPTAIMGGRALRCENPRDMSPARHGRPREHRGRRQGCRRGGLIRLALRWRSGGGSIVKKALRLTRIPALTFIALALLGCNKKEIEQLKTENKTLTEEKQRSQRELGAAGAATAEMQSTLDDVQRSLEDLRVKELKAVRTSIAVAQEGKTAAAQKRDELKAEIEEIRNSVKANLAKLSALQKQKHASDEKATTLERLVGELRHALEEKEATIAALEVKTTEELRGAVQEKEANVKEKEAVIADRETQMSTAYVLIASQSALKKAGLVEKKGSVLGLGGNWQRTGQFDETLFKQVDTRKETEFAVGAAPDKARVLSDHPKDSYTLAGTGPKASTLTVTDAARFWKGSKYLVVMLPD